MPSSRRYGGDVSDRLHMKLNAADDDVKVSHIACLWGELAG